MLLKERGGLLSKRRDCEGSRKTCLDALGVWAQVAQSLASRLSTFKGGPRSPPFLIPAEYADSHFINPQDLKPKTHSLVARPPRREGDDQWADLAIYKG